jgi:CheY-like chemotaxis protein
MGNRYETAPTDLNALIEKTWKEFFRGEKRVKGHKTLEDGLWFSSIDAGQIEQVLLHMYANAWEAMPDGGEFHVGTENVVLDQNYADFFDVPKGNYIKITLTDTGEGINHETQELMFDPFFTTRHGRIGLGMTFAQKIVANHGGVINVYSEKGQGTAVNIYLPASPGKAQLKEATHPDQITQGSETVLLVDDDRIILEVGGEMLREMGYHVRLANSGKEALQLYTEQEDPIDLVILDMIMPDMDGRKTYEKLREINPDIKVLLASGYSITGQVTEILKGGFNGFIQKPFNMIRLSKKMRAILERKA